MGAGALLCFASELGCNRGSARQKAVQQARAREAAPVEEKAKAAPGSEKLAATIEVSNCAQLVSRICKDLGEDHFGCGLSREKIPAVGEAECKKLGPRYGALIEDLKLRADARKDPSPALAKAMQSGSDLPAFGPADAPVQVVEFLDFQCSACSHLAEVIARLRERAQPGGTWAGKVRYVARMNPLQEIHKNATLAAKAALAAQAQGKYWEYHDLLFANQLDLSAEELDKMAGKVGLDLERFRKDLKSDTINKALEKDLELAKQATVIATPTIFINGKRTSTSSLMTLVEAQVGLAQAR